MEEEEEVVLVEEEEEDADVEDCLALLNDCINGLFVVVVLPFFRFLFFLLSSRSFANSFRISMGNALKSDGSMESMVVGRNEEDEEETLRKKC